MATTYLSTKINQWEIYPIKKEHANTIAYPARGEPYHYFLTGFNSKLNTYIMKPSVGNHNDSPGTDISVDTVEENINMFNITDKNKPEVKSALQKDRELILGIEETKKKKIKSRRQTRSARFTKYSGRKSKKLKKRRKAKTKTKRRNNRLR